MTRSGSSDSRRPVRLLEKAGRWLSEESLTWLLVLLVVDIFVLPVLAPRIGSVVINAVFTGLLFSGLVAVANRGVAFVAVGVLAVAAGVLKWIAPIPGLPGTPVMAAAAAVAVFTLFTLLVLFRTLSPGPITRRRVEGAIAAYLLIAVAFAFAFELVELTQPGSLSVGAGGPEALHQEVSYFSLVTLTTVGYGDVTPVTPLARRLATLEGVVGQLYPAIILGWMVSSLKRRED